MRNRLNLGLTLLFMGFMFQAACQQKITSKDFGATEMRAPAYPLITIDPYTYAWSTTDQ